MEEDYFFFFMVCLIGFFSSGLWAGEELLLFEFFFFWFNNFTVFVIVGLLKAFSFIWLNSREFDFDFDREFFFVLLISGLLFCCFFLEKEEDKFNFVFLVFDLMDGVFFGELWWILFGCFFVAGFRRFSLLFLNV